MNPYDEIQQMVSILKREPDCQHPQIKRTEFNGLVRFTCPDCSYNVFMNPNVESEFKKL